MQALNIEWFHWWHAGAAPSAAMLAWATFCAKQLVYVTAGLWAVGVVAGGPVLRRQLLQGLLAVLLGALIATVIHRLWPQPRPFMMGLGPQWLEHAARASFPSSHATGMFALMGALLLQRRWALGALVAALGALVGWSRVYLGVHFPLDILGGLAVGLAAAWLVLRLWRLLPARCQRPAPTVAPAEGAAPVQD